MFTRLLVGSLILGCAIFAIILLGRRANAASKTPIPAAKVDLSLASTPGKQTAVFAGGCFWGTQAVFERVKGVIHGPWRCSDALRAVTDGPFAEAKEVIGGYWIIQARSREEAIEWFKRAPIANNDIIEVRQFFEMPDFPEDDQKAAEGFELRNVVD